MAVGVISRFVPLPPGLSSLSEIFTQESYRDGSAPSFMRYINDFRTWYRICILLNTTQKQGAKTMQLSALYLSVGVAVLAVGPAFAGPVDPGFRANTFAANDDGATGALPLGFSADYFGVTYTSAFVGNNGYLTFNTGQGAFTPSGLGAGYSGQPIIAPFFADVDTRGAGSGLTSFGTGTFAGHTAFGATWPLVGYFGAHTDKLNTFQVILTDRSDVGAGDFDIYFNYDQIQWETGDASGGSNGLGGISAAAGFNAGSGNGPGTFFELPGSLVNGALIDGGPDSLVAGTNDGIPGQFLFQVRNGSVVVATPEPVGMALLGVGLVGLAAARRRKA